MAAQKKVLLEVIMTDKGLEVTQKKIDKVNRSTEELTKSANVAKRNLEGVSQRANSSGKDFSRLSQGMGGLVQAYATIAAQVFALTSAYTVLKNAADFRSMQISTENLSTITGRSFTLIAKSIQEATRSALNYEQALQTANKIGSVGLNISQIERLSELAVKASQTFGGTTTDAINRFVGAIQKGETELVKQVGIALNLQQTLIKYAAVLGTTADKLSVFQKQQALANAILSEGDRVLGAVEIDPNPYEQMASAFQDLGREALQSLKILDPLINTLKDSGGLLSGIMLALAANITAKALPGITAFASELEKNQKRQAQLTKENVENQEAAARRWIAAQRGMMQANIELTTSTSRYKNAAEKALSFRTDKEIKKPGKTAQLIENGLIDGITGEVDPKSIKRVKTLVDRTLNLTVDELKDTQNTKLKGVPSFLRLALLDKDGGRAAIEQLQKSLTVAVAEIEDTAKEVDKKTKGFQAKVRAAFINTRNYAVQGALQVGQSFNNALSNVQSTYLESGPLAALKQIKVGVKEAGKNAESLGPVLKTVAQGSSALGGGLSFLATGFTKLAAAFGYITIALTILKTAWTFLQKFLPQSIKDSKAYRKEIESLAENLEETAKKTEQLNKIQALNKDGVNSLTAELTFLAGAYADFRDQIIENVSKLDTYLEKLKETNAAQQELSYIDTSEIDGFWARLGAAQVNYALATTGTRNFNNETRNLQRSMEAAAPALSNISTLLKQAGTLGEKSNFGINITKRIIEDLEKDGDKVKLALANIFKDANKLSEDDLIESIQDRLEGLDSTEFEKLIELAKEADVAFQAVAGSLGEVVETGRSLTNSIDNFSKSLVDVNSKGLIDKGTVTLLADAEKNYNAFRNQIQAAGDDTNTINNLTLELLKNIESLPAPLISLINEKGAGTDILNKYIDGVITLREELEAISINKSLAKSQEELGKELENNYKEQLKYVETVENIITLNGNILEQQQAQVNAKILQNRETIKELEFQKTLAAGNIAKQKQLEKDIETRKAIINSLESSKKYLLDNLKIEEQILKVYKERLDIASKLSSASQFLFDEKIFGRLSKVVELDKMRLELGTRIRDIFSEQLEYQNQINILQGRLSSTTDEAEESKIQEEIKYYKELITLKDLERGFTAFKLTTEYKEVELVKLKIKDQIELNKLSIERINIAKELTSFAGDAAKLEAKAGKVALANQKLLVKEKELQLLQELGLVKAGERYLNKQRDLTIEQREAIAKVLNDKKSVLSISAQEVKLERDKTTQLIKQQELLDARALDRGLGFDSDLVKSEAEAFGIFFGRAFEASFKNIKGPLETVAEGAVKVIDSSIENLGDAIVEADVTIKDAVEAIKGVARDVVKDFFVSGIKTLINSIFSKEDDNNDAITAGNTTIMVNTLQQMAKDAAGGFATVKSFLPQVVQILQSYGGKAFNPAGGVNIESGGQLSGSNSSEAKPFPAVLGDPNIVLPTPPVKDKDDNKQLEKDASKQTNLLQQSTGLLSTLYEVTGAKFAVDKANDLKTHVLQNVGNILLGTIAARSVSPLATGGIVSLATPSRPVKAPFRAYAQGGITRGPEIALMGEGSNREAIVPLPNNREIPVDLRGSGGDNIVISQNFDFTNADANSVAKLRAEARNIEERTFNRVFSEINRGGKYAKMSGRR